MPILFKGHGAEHGTGVQTHAKKEALPRLGVVAIAALLAYFMLAPHVAHLLGVQLPGAHGEDASTGHSAPRRFGLFGWFASRGSGCGMVPRWPCESGVARFFAAFNWVFDRAINAYGCSVALILRLSLIALLVYGGLMGLTYLGFQAVPVGFIPEQDKGYLVVNAELPDGASLDRSDKIIKQMSAIARNAEKVPGVWHTIDLPGYSAVLGTNISNVGGMFVILEPFEERKGDPQRMPRPLPPNSASSTVTFGQPGSQCSAPRRLMAWAPPADLSSRFKTNAGPAFAPCKGLCGTWRTKATRTRVWSDYSAASR